MSCECLSSLTVAMSFQGLAIHKANRLPTLISGQGVATGYTTDYLYIDFPLHAHMQPPPLLVMLFCRYLYMICCETDSWLVMNNSLGVRRSRSIYQPSASLPPPYFASPPLHCQLPLQTSSDSVRWAGHLELPPNEASPKMELVCINFIIIYSVAKGLTAASYITQSYSFLQRKFRPYSAGVHALRWQSPLAQRQQ